MINYINLSKDILDLSDTDVQALLDTKLSAQELIFADGDYLRERKKPLRNENWSNTLLISG